MADTYTTEAIACGLSDVAGWLENEGGRGELERLSAAAADGPWSVSGVRRSFSEKSCVFIDAPSCPGLLVLATGDGAQALEALRDARFVAALVNAYRSGKLVPASLAALGTGDGSGGAAKAALDELEQAAIAFAKADRIRADAVEVYNTAWLAADTDDYKVARKLTTTESASLNAAVEVIARAQIRLHKAATATLRASQEQNGEVRDV
ncbi:hypothetical protein [Methylobacterium mesophilicum]